MEGNGLKGAFGSEGGESGRKDTEFIELVSRELMRQNIDKCIELAEKHGLSKMTMDEITNEVKAVRKNAKNSY